ncbi:MAG: flagellar basal-body rod protein FlgF [Alphaproteobacteria bacterium]|nr:flagellar basal-body rod protein FlgF [Alphaproteobacteria bacterium]
MQGAGLVLTSYQDSLVHAMDITANNIANVNTTGYKRESVTFDTYISRPEPTQTFQFAVENGTYRDTAQGPTLMTGNPLDVAIQGQGYLAVETQAGIRYTRAGAMQLNSEGEIVTGAGDKVLGDGQQPITLPSDAQQILIGSDGTISVQSGTSSSATQVGKLVLVKFANENSLSPVGNNLYASGEAPIPEADGVIVQGAIEQSNVQSVSEMTRMIDVSRTYQQVVHLLELENERQSRAIQRLGKATA